MIKENYFTRQQQTDEAIFRGNVKVEVKGNEGH